MASALDRTKVSDRKATLVIATTAKELGHDISEFNINRSSIRRSRAKQRKTIAEEIKQRFSASGPLVVHWDGKILPDLQETTKWIDFLF
jgi:hypothetical protein